MQHSDIAHADNTFGRQCVRCYHVFSRRNDRDSAAVRAHFKTDHPGKVRELVDVVKQRRIYGCGFEGCYVVCRHHYDFSAHLHSHMLRGETRWSFSWMIHNLLEYPRLSKYWRDACATLCPVYGVSSDKLQWNYSPRNQRLRSKLEYFDFEEKFGDFIVELFLAGLPHELQEQSLVLPKC